MNKKAPPLSRPFPKVPQGSERKLLARSRAKDGPGSVPGTLDPAAPEVAVSAKAEAVGSARTAGGSWEAFDENDEIIAKFRRENGRDIETWLKQGGWTEAHVAARKGLTTVVNSFRHKGVDVANSKSSMGATMLILAASAGHVITCELLLEANAQVDARDQFDDSALAYACERGHQDVVKLLLQESPKVNMKNNKGYAALHLAAEAGHARVVELLLECNADVSASGAPDIFTAETNAASSQRSSSRASPKQGLLEILLGCRQMAAADDDMALHLAASKGHLEVSDLLVKGGAKVDSKNGKGRTALHEASHSGNIAVVDLLLQRGARAEVEDTHGNIALHLALKKGHHEVALRILEGETPVDVRDVQGYTPMHLAAADCPELLYKMATRCPDVMLRDLNRRPNVMVSELQNRRGPSNEGKLGNFL